MRRAIRLLAISGLTFAFLGLMTWAAVQLDGLTAGTASAAPANEASTVTVLVGGGQDTLQMLANFPMNVRVHAGDAVTFKINSKEEIHTVSFSQGVPPGPGWAQSPVQPPGVQIPAFVSPLPGGGPEDFMLNPAIAFPTRFPGAPQESYSGNGYVNSGLMSAVPLAPDAPLFDTLTVTFDTPGTFTYQCLVHSDRMWGTIEVVSAETSVPGQDAIDAQAQLEMATFSGLFPAARAQAQALAKPTEPGPAGTSLAFVRAGMTELFSGDGRAHVNEFFPRDATVRVGDTIVWGSTYFHSVTFSPTPEIPDLFIEQPQPQGPPLLPLNPRVWRPAKPTATYDPAQYYNSADMGPFSPIGSTFALTFDRPGTYEYMCLFHAIQGMKGTVTVVPR
jgi:plastocyanin